MTVHPTDAELREQDTGDVAAAIAEGGEQRSRRPLIIGLALMVLFVAVRLFVAQPMLTHGSSMEPTLHDGDALLIEHVSYRLHDPAIGEIVVATAPDDGQSVVKRVVAVSGDTVGIEDGVLVRNGRAVSEPYADQTQMDGYFWGPVVVPAGQVFLLGDNRLESHDSRAYGPVAVDAVQGRLLTRIWPL
ncbi:MAG: signal peptidase [Actinomycetota bacterium]